MACQLDKYTYMVRHNPNCPSPFEIRTGGDAGTVEVGKAGNLVTYGKTFDEAAGAMLIAIRRHEQEKREAIRAAQRERERVYADRRLAGAVWA